MDKEYLNAKAYCEKEDRLVPRMPMAIPVWEIEKELEGFCGKKYYNKASEEVTYLILLYDRLLCLLVMLGINPDAIFDLVYNVRTEKANDRTITSLDKIIDGFNSGSSTININNRADNQYDKIFKYRVKNGYNVSYRACKIDQKAFNKKCGRMFNKFFLMIREDNGEDPYSQAICIVDMIFNILSMLTELGVKPSNILKFVHNERMNGESNIISLTESKIERDVYRRLKSK